MKVHYTNGTFYLELEGENLRISNPDILYNFGKEFNGQLPEGIDYKINSECIKICSHECFYEGCSIKRTVTLFVKEEKEPELPHPSSYAPIKAEYVLKGSEWNQAIDAVLSLCDSGAGSTRSEIEKLKK